MMVWINIELLQSFTSCHIARCSCSCCTLAAAPELPAMVQGICEELWCHSMQPQQCMMQPAVCMPADNNPVLAHRATQALLWSMGTATGSILNLRTALMTRACS
jgi:hypothetical protein